MKITAAEARKLAGPTIEEQVDEVYALIREQATKGERKVHLHSPLWTHGGYSKTPQWQQAVSLLTAEGYEVSFFYEERQFVDMYTIVKW